jgi:hypothetical protein
MSMPHDITTSANIIEPGSTIQSSPSIFARVSNVNWTAIGKNIIKYSRKCLGFIITLVITIILAFQKLCELCDFLTKFDEKDQKEIYRKVNKCIRYSFFIAKKINTVSFWSQKVCKTIIKHGTELEEMILPSDFFQSPGE